MINKPLIGALVGMGPQSTCPFYHQVMAEATKQYNAQYDIDFPNLLMYSLPTPFVVGKPIDEALMKQQLARGIHTLVDAGVQLIAVPCNVVHLYHDYMQQEAGDIPVLNMIELTTNAINARSDYPIAILATEPTTSAEIYQKHLIKQNLQPFIDSRLQTLTNQLIQCIKTQTITSDLVQQQWVTLIDYLQANKCHMALIGCTDLSSCVTQYPQRHMKFIDSMHALARAFISQMVNLWS